MLLLDMLINYSTDFFPRFILNSSDSDSFLNNNIALQYLVLGRANL